MTLSSAGAGADTLTGGAGIDTASYAASTVGGSGPTLATGTGNGRRRPGRHACPGIENIVGSNSRWNILTGRRREANVLDGGHREMTRSSAARGA